MRFDHRFIGFMVAILVGASGVATSAAAGPVEHLPGRWSGWGKMTMAGGDIERVKCVATYFSEQGGSRLRHNLRCASSSYRIDAAAKLKLAGKSVSGNWEERTYSTGGEVSGKVVNDGFSVRIVGNAFQASMQVATSKCKQSMSITPQGGGIGVQRIAVELAKC